MPMPRPYANLWATCRSLLPLRYLLPFSSSTSEIFLVFPLNSIIYLSHLLSLKDLLPLSSSSSEVSSSYPVFISAVSSTSKVSSSSLIFYL